MGKKRDWGNPDGHADGSATSFTASNGDGYELTVTLQENVDGILVCSGLNIQLIDKERAPDVPINSRFFQLLGFGQILNEVRDAYVYWGETLSEIYFEIDIEREIKNWNALGPIGFPDEKYAALAYMYTKFVREGLENPVTALAEFMGCEKNTASSRVMEARNRGLLTKPKLGTFGGKLTSKAELLLSKHFKKEGGKDAQKSK
jgi:hypothetical protein